MRIVKIIYMAISLLLVLLLAFSVVNMTVSLKYKIEERAAMGMDTIPLEWGRRYLLTVIDTYRFFLYYVLLSMAVIASPFIVKKLKGSK